MAAPHLLYTAWSFPPSRAGGVYRALATVNAFAAAGWDVTVLTAPREVWTQSTGADTALEARVDDSVTILRLPADVPAFQNDLAQWSWGRARHPEWWKLQDLRKDMVVFPEPNYGRWRPTLERAAERVHAARAVDLAIGTANPHVDFTPGWHLGRIAGVPYVMDYRDAWQLDVFSGDRLITAVPQVRRWERRLMAEATEIWFVNDAIRRWHQQEHPSAQDKMHVVANGFDEYDVPLAVPVRAEESRPLVFGYIGTISDKVPMTALLEGWRRARSTAPDLIDATLRIHGYLGHFGSGSTTLARALKEARVDGVEYAGPVSKASIGEVYRGLDALVLALGTGAYVTSGKVYEYAATGIPIVSVHDPGNAATDVLTESPAWVPTASLDPADIAQALARTAELARRQDQAQRQRAQEWARPYGRTRQLAPRIAALRPPSS